MTETMIFEEIYRDNEGKISDGIQVNGTDDGLKITTAFEGQTDDLVIPWEDVLTVTEAGTLDYTLSPLGSAANVLVIGTAAYPAREGGS